MNWVRIIIQYTITVSILLYSTGCDIFSAGSYPYAEEYELKVTEADLIAAIQNFKNENPQYDVPAESGLNDGRRDSTDHWHHVYFYYPREDLIIYAWTRPEYSKATKFAFVAVNKGRGIGKWKDINKDLSRKDNRQQKKLFETRILNKIKSRLKLE